MNDIVRPTPGHKSAPRAADPLQTESGRFQEASAPNVGSNPWGNMLAIRAPGNSLAAKLVVALSKVLANYISNGLVFVTEVPRANIPTVAVGVRNPDTGNMHILMCMLSTKEQLHTELLSRAPIGFGGASVKAFCTIAELGEQMRMNERDLRIQGSDSTIILESLRQASAWPELVNISPEVVGQSNSSNFLPPELVSEISNWNKDTDVPANLVALGIRLLSVDVTPMFVYEKNPSLLQETYHLSKRLGGNGAVTSTYLKQLQACFADGTQVVPTHVLSMTCRNTNGVRNRVSLFDNAASTNSVNVGVNVIPYIGFSPSPNGTEEIPKLESYVVLTPNVTNSVIGDVSSELPVFASFLSLLYAAVMFHSTTAHALLVPAIAAGLAREDITPQSVIDLLVTNKGNIRGAENTDDALYQLLRNIDGSTPVASEIAIRVIPRGLGDDMNRMLAELAINPNNPYMTMFHDYLESQYPGFGTAMQAAIVGGPNGPIMPIVPAHIVLPHFVGVSGNQANTPRQASNTSFFGIYGATGRIEEAQTYVSMLRGETVTTQPNATEQGSALYATASALSVLFPSVSQPGIHEQFYKLNPHYVAALAQVMRKVVSPPENIVYARATRLVSHMQAPAVTLNSGTVNVGSSHPFGYSNR